MLVAPRRHQHFSCSANRPSDVAVTVIFNPEFHLMAVNPRIECFWRNLVPEYCQGWEPNMGYTAPRFFVESLQGCSNRSLPRLPLPMHAEELIPTLLRSNIDIRLCLQNALTLARFWSYKMFDGILIVTINRRVGLWGHLNVRLLRDSFPYWLAQGIPLKERVP